MKTTAIIAVALAALSNFSVALAAPDSTKVLEDPPSKVFARQDAPKQSPSEPPISDGLRSQGCYEYAGSNYTKINVPTTELSDGKCGDTCKEKNYKVAGLYGGACYCGSFYPPEGSMVKDTKCDFPCPGYPKEACGSLGSPRYWSIFNTGKDVNVEPMPKEKKEDDEDSDKDDKDDKKKPSETTSAAGTSTSAPSAPSATETQGNDDDGDKKDEKKTNTAGIAAGVVVGVAVIAGGIGGLFFWMRRRRNHELEEDHRRNAAVNAFINGSKPPSSHGSISMTDSRMDPVLANRRLSDGSIADNQDYSRRILRVTNA